MKKKKDILNSWPGSPGLIMIDSPSDPLECDFCDNIKPLAHIEHFNGNVIDICQDCLWEFANAFKTEKDE